MRRRRKKQQAIFIQDQHDSLMSRCLALSNRSIANENEVMETLAAIVTDVERYSNLSRNTLFLTSFSSCVSNGGEYRECGSS